MMFKRYKRKTLMYHFGSDDALCDICGHASELHLYGFSRRNAKELARCTCATLLVSGSMFCDCDFVNSEFLTDN